MENLYKLSAYNYDLPKELIAQTAHEPADECKLLYYKNGKIKDLIFKDIENILDENDVLFFNNSKVVKARIQSGLQDLTGWKDNVLQVDSEQWVMNNEDEIRFYLVDDEWNKKECRNCEILFLRKLGDWGICGDLGDNRIDVEKTNIQISSYFEALVRPWKKFKIWRKIVIEKGNKNYEFEVVDFSKEWRIIQYKGDLEIDGDNGDKYSEKQNIEGLKVNNDLVVREKDIYDVLDEIGKMPLPPYISYSKEKEKPYQPVQAKKEWSVAAPTASLHFTKNLFSKLKEKNIQFLESTLHIGMWTFKTVDVEDITNYDIHSEQVEIPLDIFEKIWKLKLDWKKITAVWTTATRILESLPYLYKLVNSEQWIVKSGLQDIAGFQDNILQMNSRENKIKSEYFDELMKDIDVEQANKFIDTEVFIQNDMISFSTKLYIFPWFKYKLVDNLITNFHLPKSSLLMLVAAFMGYENMKKAYQHAIEKKYRFFSFWDAMFIHLK